MSTGTWPALSLDSWRATYRTLHMWMQVVGKLTLRHTPLVNHWWNVAFHYTARGFTTLPMQFEARTLTASFDFLSHELQLRISDGASEIVRLEPKSVARFHAEVMEALARLGLSARIWTMPVEVQNPIRFELDTAHGAYDPRAVGAFWQAMLSMRPVLDEFRCAFVGKCSPVHFFWGSFDLAVTRFSGRQAIPPADDRVTREAYSHEVISHGFWPGGPGFEEPAFYAYARPEPKRFADARVEPASARYEPGLQEFVLPYEAVRKTASPERTLEAFLASTYDHAATLAKWDRASLERR